MRIVLPKTLCEIDYAYGPLFFFAGPVLGGDDWQAAACMRLRRILPKFHAVVPCRYVETHPMQEFRLKGRENAFLSQTRWERHYIDMATVRRKSCMVFWLPAESKTNPRPIDQGPYGRDTFGELGEVRGRMRHERELRAVFGAEERFPGIKQIADNFTQVMGASFKLHASLDDTLRAAIEVASR